MKARFVIAMLVVLPMSWMIAGSLASASSDSDKAEIVALNQHLAEAFDKRDINAMIACYVDDKDTVFYEDTIPFQLDGTSGLRKYNQELFEGSSQIHMEVETGVDPFSWTLLGRKEEGEPQCREPIHHMRRNTGAESSSWRGRA